jgi:hypothetical protein
MSEDSGNITTPPPPPPDPYRAVQALVDRLSHGRTLADRIRELRWKRVRGVEIDSDLDGDGIESTPTETINQQQHEI